MRYYSTDIFSLQRQLACIAACVLENHTCLSVYLTEI